MEGMLLLPVPPLHPKPPYKKQNRLILQKAAAYMSNAAVNCQWTARCPFQLVDNSQYRFQTRRKDKHHLSLGRWVRAGAGYLRAVRLKAE